MHCSSEITSDFLNFCAGHKLTIVGKSVHLGGPCKFFDSVFANHKPNVIDKKPEPSIGTVIGWIYINADLSQVSGICMRIRHIQVRVSNRLENVLCNLLSTNNINIHIGTYMVQVEVGVASFIFLRG